MIDLIDLTVTTGQVRSEVLRFGVEKCLFRGQDVFLLYI